MRVRTDEKRQAILSAARAVFEEMGYARASMAAISARLGGSKATLYGYFSTKEQLFAAAMTEALSEPGDEMLALLDESDADVAAVLTRFGVAYLAFITSPEILSQTRVAVAESPFSDVGRELYALGPNRALSAVETYLAVVSARGWLQVADAKLAALQFKGLLETSTLEPLLYGVVPSFSAAEVAAAAARALTAAYAAPAA